MVSPGLPRERRVDPVAAESAGHRLESALTTAVPNRLRVVAARTAEVVPQGVPLCGCELTPRADRDPRVPSLVWIMRPSFWNLSIGASTVPVGGHNVLSTSRALPVGEVI